MNIFFLDQSGNIGGAELCLLDIAKHYRDSCLVGLLTDGPFKDLLQQHNIPVRVLGNQSIAVRKDSGFIQGLSNLRQLAPLIAKVVKISVNYDLIYANTQKALVVGAIASFLSRRPLVYHLHDIISSEHFSETNRQIAVRLANRFASLVIANSVATQSAFIAAGGRAEITKVVYNGFATDFYRKEDFDISKIRQEIGLERRFLVGSFSRLSPWKGQHILIESLTHCAEDVAAVLVGDDLFGEQGYAKLLHQKVAQLGLKERVKFLGFRSDIVPLMKACDLIVHTSTAPEPFGRVIVEAMLCGKPVIASKAGGAVELIETNKTGWLVMPSDSIKLADAIATCRSQPELTASVALQGRDTASQRFNITAINQQIHQLLSGLVKSK